MLLDGIGRLTDDEVLLCEHLDDGCFPSEIDGLQARLVREHVPVRLLGLLSALPSDAHYKDISQLISALHDRRRQ